MVVARSCQNGRMSNVTTATLLVATVIGGLVLFRSHLAQIYRSRSLGHSTRLANWGLDTRATGLMTSLNRSRFPQFERTSVLTGNSKLTTGRRNAYDQ